MQELTDNSSFHTERELLSTTQLQPHSDVPLICFQISINVSNNGIVYESSKPVLQAFNNSFIFTRDH